MELDNGQSNELSQHQLVGRLLEGSISEILFAQAEMEKNEEGVKGDEKEHIMRAISILDALRGGLDLDAGGEIAENLFSLYEYMGRRLVDGYQHGDVEMMVEVKQLLDRILAGWNKISDEDTKQPLQQAAMA